MTAKQRLAADRHRVAERDRNRMTLVTLSLSKGDPTQQVAYIFCVEQ
jgi:hypothetical protein